MPAQHGPDPPQREAGSLHPAGRRRLVRGHGRASIAARAGLTPDSNLRDRTSTGRTGGEPIASTDNARNLRISVIPIIFLAAGGSSGPRGVDPIATTGIARKRRVSVIPIIFLAVGGYSGPTNVDPIATAGIARNLRISVIPIIFLAVGGYSGPTNVDDRHRRHRPEPQDLSHSNNLSRRWRLQRGPRASIRSPPPEWLGTSELQSFRQFFREPGGLKLRAPRASIRSPRRAAPGSSGSQSFRQFFLGAGGSIGRTGADPIATAGIGPDRRVSGSQARALAARGSIGRARAPIRSPAAAWAASGPMAASRALGADVRTGARTSIRCRGRHGRPAGIYWHPGARARG